MEEDQVKQAVKEMTLEFYRLRWEQLRKDGWIVTDVKFGAHFCDVSIFNGSYSADFRIPRTLGIYDIHKRLLGMCESFVAQAALAERSEG